MGNYAIVGDTEVDVTVGANHYRAYAIGIAGGGNQIEARAFVDDPADTAVVIANKSRDLTLRFRFDPGLSQGDEVTVNVTVAGDTTSYPATVTSTDFNVDVAGIADYAATLRVNPSQSS